MYNELRIVIEEKVIFNKVICDGEELEIGEKKSPDAESIRFINEFHEKYKKNFKNEVKETFRREYIFDSRKVDFDEIFGQIREYDKKIGFSIYTETCYEKKDYEDAVAFLVSFPKECYYYDEDDDESFNSQIVPCEDCYCWEHKEKIYIRPNNGLKKQFEQKAMGASTNMDLEIISPGMYDFLIKNGISENCFKPVYQKNGIKWAYSFYGGENKLPSFSLFSERYGIFKRCEVCGRVDLIPQYFEDTGSVRAKIEDALNIGAYPISEKFEIQSSVLGKMADVNITTDYFGGTRYMVFSRRIFELLKSKMPKIERTSQPIFEGHWKPSTEGDKIVLKPE